MKTTPALCTFFALAACSSEPTDAPQAEPPAAPTNRLDVPKAVRDNLGIEYAEVQRRRVAATVRLPGQFELLPAARHEHRAMLAGHVEVHVALLQRVEAGELLCTLDSPDWRARQRELGDLRTQTELDAARIAALEPLLAAHDAHEKSLADAIEILSARVEQLERTRRDVGGQAAEIAAANVTLAQLRASAAEAAEQHTGTQTRLVELQAAVRAGNERFALALAAAATFARLGTEQLAAGWRELDRIEVRATMAGVVDRVAVAAGGFVEDGALLVTVTDPTKARFRAHAPQRDLGRLRAGSPARVAPPAASRPGGDPIEGELRIGVDIDRKTRMVELFLDATPAPDWARPGLGAFLEVETESGGAAELAIPRAAVQRDGLSRVIFRRDSKNPDQVIRLEVDFGVDDGEWIVVKTDLTDGDEVVVAGAYELMLASSESTPKGGHFHADGTWHAGDH